MCLFYGLDSVQPFHDLCRVIFESVLQWHAKKAVVDAVCVGVVIGICFSYSDSELMEFYLDGSRDGVTMKGIIPCIPILDAAFDDSLGKTLTPAGDGMSAFIKVGTLKLSQ